MNHGGCYRLWTPLVILAALATYLAGGGSVHLWDRDEAWYAQSSKQMVESGNWVVTYFLDQPRYSKPIFVYWCQAVCMKVLGPTERAARLPSAIAMTITLSILAVSIGRALGARRAFYTVLVFASSVMVIASAKMCLTDSVLLTFLTTAQLCLFAIYWRSAQSRASVLAGRDCQNAGALPRPARALALLAEASETVSYQRRISGWLPVVLWLAVAFAGLTKGPIVLAVLLASLIALAGLEAGGQWRSLAAWKRAVGWWRELRPLLGVLIIAAVVAPWLIAAWVRDPAYVRNMFIEPLRHTTSNQDGQWMLPGYYLVAIWPTFFPWCAFLPLLLISAWRHRRTPHVRFALATVLGNWVLSELMVTKLPHYLLPSFASLAFLCATAIIRAARGEFRGLFGRHSVPGAGLWAIGATLLAAIPWLPAHDFDRFPRAAAMIFTAVAGAYIGAVATLTIRRRLGGLMPVMGVGMLALVVVLYAFYCPAARFLRMPVEIGRSLRQHDATAPGQVIMSGFCEPSVAFYQGGTIRERDPEFLLRAPVEQWPRWIVATETIYHALRTQAPAKADRLREVARFQGLNYNAGARSDLYSKVDTAETHLSTIAVRQGNEYKSLIRIETVLILEKVAP